MNIRSSNMSSGRNALRLKGGRWAPALAKYKVKEVSLPGWGGSSAVHEQSGFYWQGSSAPCTAWSVGQ